MGSSIEGSSSAARSAQSKEAEQTAEPAPRGFLGRILNALSSSEPEAEASASPRATATGPALPGLSNLRKLRVDDVAIPKVDIIAVPTDIGKEALVEVFREHGFSRVPVFKGTLDHPQGLVMLKDLALQHGFGATGRFSLKRLLRPVLYAPPSMPVGMLLQKMQRERVHMALVIDEYGGVDGLVTIEDLIETIIGEIEDEHDEDEGAMWKEEAPGLYLAQSTAPLDEFEQAVGMRLRSVEEDEEIDTIGGLVFLRTGRVPSRGEIVTLENGVEFEVVDVDPRRIKRLRVRLPSAARADAAPETGSAPSEAADGSDEDLAGMN